MRVLLLASYCDENGCCDELPCEECLAMCNVAEITGKYKVKSIHGYGYARSNLIRNGEVKEKPVVRRCDEVSCDMCPYEDECLGEE